MWCLLLILWVSSASAGEVRYLYDKSYPRDNAFCKMGKRTIEFQLRGTTQLTDPGEKGFGEIAFFLLDRQKPSSLQLGVESSGTYRFFKTEGTLCSKSAGFHLGSNDLALLFLKENRPFRGKLVIQIFDPRALRAKELVETEHMPTMVRTVPKGFAFNSVEEARDIDYGVVILKDQDFRFQNKKLTLWRIFDHNGMAISPEITFEQFPWKHLFRDRAHFLVVTSWDRAEKKFQKRHFYWAVSHPLGQECLFFSAGKTKPLGTEDWLCADLAPQVN